MGQRNVFFLEPPYSSRGFLGFSFLGDTGLSDDQKQDENRVFAYFRPILHLYFLLPHDPTHFAAKPYTVKGFV